MKDTSKALLYTLACVILWSFIPVVSRFGQISLDHYQFLFWSSVLSLIVVCVCTVSAKKTPQLLRYSGSQFTHALFLGFLGTYLYYLLLYYGYANTQGLEVLVLQYTWPIFIVVFSPFLLRERITGKTIIAALLGFSGIALVLTKGDIAQIHLANVDVDAIVLLAAAVFGLFSVLSKRSTYEPYSLTVLLFLSATIFSTISMLLLSEFAFPSKDAWLPIVLNGAFINGISYILWIFALKHGKASFIAPFVFLTPTLSAFHIVFFFGEPLLPVYLIGLCTVIVAGLLTVKA